MYRYSNELTLYAGVQYTQPSWYSFSSWPHSDITTLGHSVTCTFLASQKRCFWDRISILFKSIKVVFLATQNTCDRYNKFVTAHLKIILCTIGTSVIGNLNVNSA